MHEVKSCYNYGNCAQNNNSSHPSICECAKSYQNELLWQSIKNAIKKVKNKPSANDRICLAREILQPVVEAIMLDASLELKKITRLYHLRNVEKINRNTCRCFFSFDGQNGNWAKDILEEIKREANVSKDNKAKSVFQNSQTIIVNAVRNVTTGQVIVDKLVLKELILLHYKLGELLGNIEEAHKNPQLHPQLIHSSSTTESLKIRLDDLPFTFKSVPKKFTKQQEWLDNKKQFKDSGKYRCTGLKSHLRSKKEDYNNYCNDVSREVLKQAELIKSNQSYEMLRINSLKNKFLPNFKRGVFQNYKEPPGPDTLTYHHPLSTFPSTIRIKALGSEHGYVSDYCPPCDNKGKMQKCPEESFSQIVDRMLLSNFIASNVSISQTQKKKNMPAIKIKKKLNFHKNHLSKGSKTLNLIPHNVEKCINRANKTILKCMNDLENIKEFLEGNFSQHNFCNVKECKEGEPHLHSYMGEDSIVLKSSKDALKEDFQVLIRSPNESEVNISINKCLGCKLCAMDNIPQRNQTNKNLLHNYYMFKSQNKPLVTNNPTETFSNFSLDNQVTLSSIKFNTCNRKSSSNYLIFDPDDPINSFIKMKDNSFVKAKRTTLMPNMNTSLKSVSCVEKSEIDFGGNSKESYFEFDHLSLINPTKSGQKIHICSSMEIDVNTVETTLRNNIYHPNKNVCAQLKTMGMENILRACRPPKCCRKAILNEPSRESLPYVPSLESLPLCEEDLDTIRKSIVTSFKNSLKRAKKVTNYAEKMYYNQKFVSNEFCSGWRQTYDVRFLNETTSFKHKFWKQNKQKRIGKINLSYYIYLVTDDFYSLKVNLPVYEVRMFDYEKTNEFKIEQDSTRQFNLTTNTRKSSGVFEFYQMYNSQLKAASENAINKKLNTETMDKKLFTTLYSNPIRILEHNNDTSSSVKRPNLKLKNSPTRTAAGVYKIKRKENYFHCFNCRINDRRTLAPSKYYELERLARHNKSKRSNSTGNGSNVVEPGCSTLDDALYDIEREINCHNFKEIKEIEVTQEKTDVDETKKKGRKDNFIHQLMNDKLKVSPKVNEENLSFLLKLKIGDTSTDSAVLGDEEEQYSGLIVHKLLDADPQNASITSLASQKEGGGCCGLFKKKNTHEKMSPTTGPTIDKPVNKATRRQSKVLEAATSDVLSINVFSLSGENIPAFYDSEMNLITEIHDNFGQPTTNRSSKPINLLAGLIDEDGYLRDGVCTQDDKPLIAVYNEFGEALITFYNSHGQQILRGKDHWMDCTSSIFSLEGTRINRVFDARGKPITSIQNEQNETIAGVSSHFELLAPSLFDDNGNFIQGLKYQGKPLEQVYDINKRPVETIYDIRGNPFQKRMRNKLRVKTLNRVFDSFGDIVDQLMSPTPKLEVSSIYDIRNNLIKRAKDPGDMVPYILDDTGNFRNDIFDSEKRKLKKIYNINENELKHLYNRAGQKLKGKKLPKTLIYDEKGVRVDYFYNEDGEHITAILDKEGKILQGVSRKAALLLPGLTDKNGKIAPGRFDNFGKEINALYDAKRNIIFKINDPVIIDRKESVPSIVSSNQISYNSNYLDGDPNSDVHGVLVKKKDKVGDKESELVSNISKRVSICPTLGSQVPDSSEDDSQQSIISEIVERVDSCESLKTRSDLESDDIGILETSSVMLMEPKLDNDNKETVSMPLMSISELPTINDDKQSLVEPNLLEGDKVTDIPKKIETEIEIIKTSIPKQGSPVKTTSPPKNDQISEASGNVKSWTSIDVTSSAHNDEVTKSSSPVALIEEPQIEAVPERPKIISPEVVSLKTDDTTQSSGVATNSKDTQSGVSTNSKDTQTKRGIPVVNEQKFRPLPPETLTYNVSAKAGSSDLTGSGASDGSKSTHRLTKQVLEALVAKSQTQGLVTTKTKSDSKVYTARGHIITMIKNRDGDVIARSEFSRASGLAEIMLKPNGKLRSGLYDERNYPIESIYNSEGRVIAMTERLKHSECQCSDKQKSGVCISCPVHFSCKRLKKKDLDSYSIEDEVQRKAVSQVESAKSKKNRNVVEECDCTLNYLKTLQDQIRGQMQTINDDFVTTSQAKCGLSDVCNLPAILSKGMPQCPGQCEDVRNIQGLHTAGGTKKRSKKPRPKSAIPSMTLGESDVEFEEKPNKSLQKPKSSKRASSASNQEKETGVSKKKKSPPRRKPLDLGSGPHCACTACIRRRGKILNQDAFEYCKNAKTINNNVEIKSGNIFLSTLQKKNDSVETLLGLCSNNKNLSNFVSTSTEKYKGSSFPITVEIVEEVLKDCLHSDKITMKSNSLIKYFASVLLRHIRCKFFKRINMLKNGDLKSGSIQNFINGFRQEVSSSFAVAKSSIIHNSKLSVLVNASRIHQKLRFHFTNQNGLSKKAFLCSVPNAYPFILFMQRKKYAKLRPVKTDRKKNSSNKKDDMSSASNAFQEYLKKSYSIIRSSLTIPSVNVFADVKLSFFSESYLQSAVKFPGSPQKQIKKQLPSFYSCRALQFSQHSFLDVTSPWEANSNETIKIKELNKSEKLPKSKAVPKLMPKVYSSSGVSKNKLGQKLDFAFCSSSTNLNNLSFVLNKESKNNIRSSNKKLFDTKSEDFVTFGSESTFSSRWTHLGESKFLQEYLNIDFAKSFDEPPSLESKGNDASFNQKECILGYFTTEIGTKTEEPTLSYGLSTNQKLQSESNNNNQNQTVPTNQDVSKTNLKNEKSKQIKIEIKDLTKQGCLVQVLKTENIFDNNNFQAKSPSDIKAENGPSVPPEEKSNSCCRSKSKGNVKNKDTVIGDKITNSESNQKLNNVDKVPSEEQMFWALTKVTLFKNGTKNFEILDVSPVPPSYYKVPNVNNVLIVDKKV